MKNDKANMKTREVSEGKLCNSEAEKRGKIYHSHLDCAEKETTGVEKQRWTESLEKHQRPDAVFGGVVRPINSSLLLHSWKLGQSNIHGFMNAMT